MVKGISSNVTAQKLLKRGYAEVTQGLRQGVTEYTKTLQKSGGTRVSYFFENGVPTQFTLVPGASHRARLLNDVHRIHKTSTKGLVTVFGSDLNRATVYGPTAYKGATQYNAQLKKEGYDLTTRMDAITRAFA